jgi:putative CocE/NonD family hydrolase
MPATPASAPIREIENLWITLADGCRLAARLFMPADAESKPVPAILEYLPYRKRDFTRRRDEGMHRWFAAHGYVAVRVDMRGSGESEGLLHDEYLALEQSDAIEVIDWLSRQPWCSGQVGMMGKSWGAFNSLQVASHRPPALKALIAVMGTDDRYREDIHYSGGCLLNDNFWWGCIMQVFNARPPDPLIVGERWRELWRERLEAERFWPEIWLEHQRLDEYWKHGSIRFDYASIETPTWFWGGWADLYRDTPLRLAQHLRAPHRVTVGPWGHLYPHEGLPHPAVGFLQAALAWWDHWLKGEDRGVLREPPLHFYMMEGVEPRPFHAERPGRWVSEHTWPSPRVELRRFAINAEGLRSTAAPEQVLTLCSPQTTGLAAGDWGSFAIPGDLPGEQSLDAAGSLEFDLPPLEERLEILGNAQVILELAADRPDALVAVRLIDVAPDRRASCVARGLKNLTHRESDEHPVALEPGRRYRVSIELTGTAYAFAPGHRIRIALSTAYWPIVWPSPSAATLTLFTGACELKLPVRSPERPAHAAAQPVRSTERPAHAAAHEAAPSHPYLQPTAAPQGAVTTLRPGRLERSVTRDEVSGEVTHRLFIDGGVFGDCGKLRLEDIGLELAHVSERIYRIKPEDPNSAHALMRQSYEMGRGDWQVRIETSAQMTSTPSSFELEAWVEAFEGERSVLRKEWRSSIPRKHV